MYLKYYVLFLCVLFPPPYFTEVWMTETRENMVVSSSNSGDSYTAQEGFFHLAGR